MPTAATRTAPMPTDSHTADAVPTAFDVLTFRERLEEN